MRIYLHPASRLRLSVEGELAGESVAELERCWRALMSLEPRVTMLIDVRALESADEEGYRLLDIMRRQGVIVKGRCAASSPFPHGPSAHQR